MDIANVALNLRSDWRSYILGDYLRKWVVLGLMIGIVAGVGAIVFFQSIDWATQLFLGNIAGLDPPVPRGEGTTVVSHVDRKWLIPLCTTVGGLLSGIIVFSLAPEAEGHGTDAAIDAFHERGGHIRSRIPAIKLIASALTIGSGGSAGREGPTAQIAAGFGSWLGDIFKLSPQDRRIALAVGVGSGIGAIFKAPLGGAILSAEVLYKRDFELEALIPGFIASVVGYTIFAAWAGWDPVFGSGLGLEFRHPEQLVWYAVLGVICGLVGIAYVKGFYGTRDLFLKIRIPPHLKPAIGGLAVGLVALAYPEILGMGYGWLQFAIEGNTAEIAVRTMLILVALKIFATSMSIGSGGSGGVFAPGLFIGGMVGGAMFGILDGNVPWLPDVPTPFVIVGMVALFGGVAKAPIAVILMVAEMTNEFSMIVPAMIAVTIAYLITGDVTIYENQVESRKQSPAHRGEYAIPLIQTLTVEDAMRRNVDTASPEETISEAEERMRRVGRRGLPVTDDGKLVGMLTASDVLRARQDHLEMVRDVMSCELLVAYPADNLHTVLQRMTQSGISRLPVVQRERPDKLIGILTIRDLAAALDVEAGQLAAGTAEAPMSQDDPLRSIAVSDAMSKQFVSVGHTLSLTRAANRLASANDRAALVVNDDGELIGVATTKDIASAAAEEPDRTVGEVATRDVVVARPGQSIAEAFAQPRAERLNQLPVVEGREGHLKPIGVLRRSDLVAAYLRARDRQATIARRARSIEDEHGGRVVMLEMTLRSSDQAVGKTLAELKLPANAVITTLVRDGTLIVPRGQVQLETGDRIQVLTAIDGRERVRAAFRQG